MRGSFITNDKNDDSFGMLNEISKGHFESHIPAASGYFDPPRGKTAQNQGNSQIGRMTTPAGASTTNPQRNNVESFNSDHQQHDEPGIESLLFQ